MHAHPKASHITVRRLLHLAGTQRVFWHRYDALAAAALIMVPF